MILMKAKKIREIIKNWADSTDSMEDLLRKIAKLVGVEINVRNRREHRDMTFSEFSKTNRKRCEEGFKHKLNDWTVLEWCGSLCGEAGELANKAKKLRRGQNVSVDELAEEIADTVAYCDLVAHKS
jgi:NTP pyrophosphatase (non-canonical NTP hydrolase)